MSIIVQIVIWKLEEKQYKKKLNILAISIKQYISNTIKGLIIIIYNIRKILDIQLKNRKFRVYIDVIKIN